MAEPMLKYEFPQGWQNFLQTIDCARRRWHRAYYGKINMAQCAQRTVRLPKEQKINLLSLLHTHTQDELNKFSLDSWRH